MNRGSYRMRLKEIEVDLARSREIFWEARASEKQQTLADWLGADYFVFAEMIFPGSTIGHMSWQAIHGTISNWIASGKDAVMDSLECTCAPDGSTTCPVCKARARLRGEQ